LLSGSETLQIQQLLTDSRKLLFPSTSLFFALNGPRRSGTSFISELYLKGVRAFVITDDVFQTAHFPDATFIATSDPLEGLQKLAAHHRKQFNIPVIGITGSNGKTIVKEWLFQLLQHDFKIVRSPKSYNSQIGVPLSVWEINAAHNLGIFEAGISLPREMEKLEKVIQPTVGVFTNLGDAHNGGFSNTEEKVHEKLKLFTNSEIIIYCRDYKSIDDALQQSTKHQKNQQTFSWSRRDEADLRIREITEYAGSTTVDFLHAETSFSINTSFTDEASIENLITCVAVLLVLKLDVAEIRRRVATLISVDMRLQLRQGINGCSIIDDSYSADLSSLQIALDFLQQQKQHQKRTVILSDILQSGKTDDQLYQELAELLSGKNVDRLIGVGPKIKGTAVSEFT
jgi:Alr-MurF fusion protein